MKDRVVLLGTRGSIPVCSENYIKYGGDTTCIFLHMDGQSIVVDGGSGILKLPKYMDEDENKLTVLLSHPHADHLLGLPMCQAMFDQNKQIDIYGASRNGLSVKEQVDKFISPPLWPVGTDQLPAKISFYELPQKLVVGNVTIETMEGNHPGGVTLFRITGSGKSVVIMTDCTLSEDVLPTMIEFAKNCNLLLCDGQYSEEEWPKKQYFGHSTWSAAAKLGAACGAAKIRIIHHDPLRSDAMLCKAEKKLKEIHSNCMFARAEEELSL